MLHLSHPPPSHTYFKKKSFFFLKSLGTHETSWGFILPPPTDLSFLTTSSCSHTGPLKLFQQGPCSHLRAFALAVPSV